MAGDHAAQANATPGAARLDVGVNVEPSVAPRHRPASRCKVEDEVEAASRAGHSSRVSSRHVHIDVVVVVIGDGDGDVERQRR
jgi:hypothetical protein